jgi:hypothetical protein
LVNEVDVDCHIVVHDQFIENDLDVLPRECLGRQQRAIAALRRCFGDGSASSNDQD